MNRTIAMPFLLSLCACAAHAQSNAAASMPTEQGVPRPVLVLPPPDGRIYNFGSSLAETTRTPRQEAGAEWAANETKEKKYDFSIGFGGWSNHKHKTKCVKGRCISYKETNPTFELDYWLDVEFLGGRPFIGYGHVFKNSSRGTTDWMLIANQWKLIRGQYADLCGGVGGMRARYAVPQYLVPGKQNSQTENLPFVYACLEKGPLSARFVPLGKDILFMYMIYSF